MIESLFLPGKGSSESCEKGKKGESHIIFRLIQVKSHTCMILTQRQTDNIQHKFFCEMNPLLFVEYKNYKNVPLSKIS